MISGYGMGDVNEGPPNPEAEKQSKKVIALHGILKEFENAAERAIALNNINDLKCFLLGRYKDFMKDFKVWE